MRSRYANWIAPQSSADDAEPDPTQELLDKPEPDPWTHLEPLFPMNGLPFTPTSECPHFCKRCRRSGVIHRCRTCLGDGYLVDLKTRRRATICLDCEGTGLGDEPVPCPDCGGSGKADVPRGSPFVCMCCDDAGKDGTAALPLGVVPPPDPPTRTEDEDPC